MEIGNGTDPHVKNPVAIARAATHEQKVRVFRSIVKAARLHNSSGRIRSLRQSRPELSVEIPSTTETERSARRLLGELAGPILPWHPYFRPFSIPLN